MKDVIMPILSFTLGIIALYKNPNDPKKRALINSTLIIALILTCVLDIFFKHQDHVASKNDRDWSRETITKLSESLVNFQSSTETNFAELKKYFSPYFEKAGATQQAVNNFTPMQLSQGLEAETALSSTASNQGVNNRNNVEVQYFYKAEDVNPDKIAASLRELGFRVKIQEAKNGLPTNSIWYGNPVNVDDVKLVAYTLIRAGAQIRQIRHFANDASKINAQIMQVGADPEMVNAAPYTIEQIRNGQFNR